MLNVGVGAYEIRVHVLGEWRVIYVAKFADAVYVLHAFQKKTQQTRKEDIELAAPATSNSRRVQNEKRKIQSYRFLRQRIY